MILPSGDIAARVDSLAAALDEQVRLLEAKIAQLDELSQCLVASDNDRLERVLAAMEDLARRQSLHEETLLAARRELATAVDCPPGRDRLSDLIVQLTGPHRAVIQERRVGAAAMIKQLRQRHMATAMLLTECSRVNGILLDCLFPESPSVMVYGQQGADPWRSSGRLVDMER